MTQEDLKQISRIQLEMMNEVHRICVENHVKYYMIGGTLLGAVRHKGFIPWDVDIDIAIPREDYEVFKQLCETQLDPQYTYLDRFSFRNYMRPHALISHNGTRLQSKYDHLNPKLMELGVYIDIFPLDNGPDDEKLQQQHAKKLLAIRKLKDRRLMYCHSYKRWRRVIHYVAAALLCWLPVPMLNALQQKQMQKYRWCDTQYLCSMASRHSYAKQCMPREIYGEPVLLKFEGQQYYGPAQYEAYLTRIYGDYMCLPPEEERNANLEIYRTVEYL